MTLISKRELMPAFRKGYGRPGRTLNQRVINSQGISDFQAPYYAWQLTLFGTIVLA